MVKVFKIKYFNFLDWNFWKPSCSPSTFWSTQRFKIWMRRFRCSDGVYFSLYSLAPPQPEIIKFGPKVAIVMEIFKNHFRSECPQHSNLWIKAVWKNYQICVGCGKRAHKMYEVDSQKKTPRSLKMLTKKEKKISLFFTECQDFFMIQFICRETRSLIWWGKWQFCYIWT